MVAALGIAIDATVPITGDVVEDAKSTQVCCGRCDGAGSIRVALEAGYQWIECINCEGTGAVRKAGDQKAREYIYKATGFIKSESSLTVNTHVTTHSVESVIDELDRLPAVVNVTSVELAEDDA